MKLKWFKPAAFALIVFIISLVITIPARWALQYIPANSPVSLESVSGTVWRGEATQVLWQNKPVGKMNWSLKPLTLITGKLGLDFVLSDKGLNADGTAIIYRDKVVELHDTVIDADVSTLPLQQARLPVELQGRLNADMENMLIKDSLVHAAEGLINWRSAKITAPIELPMGEVSMQVTGSKGNLKGDLSSKNSAVDTRGKLELAPNGVLTSNIRLKPNAQTPEDIRELLPALGKPQRDGSVNLRYQGRLRF